MKWNALVSFAGLLSSALAVPAGPHEVEIVKRASPKAVYAHFMVGIVENYTVADWKYDMRYAQEIGIDGFALNHAKIDSYTPIQLARAYQAAQEIGFKCFMSFDFAYWNYGDTALVTEYMKLYAGHPAAAQYDGGAIVSTFVGDFFDWAPVKAAVPQKITALPMMQDPGGVTYLNTAFDGAFSWLAWPTNGGNSIIPGPITTKYDDQFLKNLAGRPYMAPVSPWFFTHFGSKNWVFISEQLITDRWEQMLVMKPSLVQIITWNDFGESHYISPPEPNHTDDGSSKWADGVPHDGWRIIMKPYIAAYKAGAARPSVSQDQLVYWYRPTPWNVQCTGDNVGPPNGREMLQDLIFVTVLMTSPGQLTVTSGNRAPVMINVPAGVTTHNFTMGVGAQDFVVNRNGARLLGGRGGSEIKNTCVVYNYNPWVGSFNATGGTVPPPPISSTRTSTTLSTLTSSSSTSSTRTSTTSTATTSTTSTRTSTTSSSTSSAPPPSGTGCIAGTGAGNYIGLCQFCCGYNYCPPGPCSCTSTGAIRPAPPASSPTGRPAPGLDNSYLGLCSYACSHGYCPPTACVSG